MRGTASENNASVSKNFLPETEVLATEALRLYKSATAVTTSTSVASSRLQESYGKYAKVLALLTRSGEFGASASVSRNLASVASARAREELRSGPPKEPLLALFWFKRSVVHSCEAYNGWREGFAWGKDERWAIDCLRKVESSCRAIYQLLVDSSDNWRVRDGHIQKFIRECSSDPRLGLARPYVLACIHLRRGRIILNAASIAYEMSTDTRHCSALRDSNGKVGDSLCSEANSCLAELESSFEVTRQSLKKLDEQDLYQQVKEESEEQQEERDSLFVKVQSTRFCKQAIDLQEAATNASDELNLDLIWDAADLFIAAMRTSRGGDFDQGENVGLKEAVTLDGEEERRQQTAAQNLECEAIAAARLGVLYQTVLKNDSLAEPFLMHSIQLAHIISYMEKRNLALNEWYIDATKSLQAIRAARDVPDCEYTPQEKYKTFAENISFQVKVSGSKTTQARKLLNYLLENHPGKNPAHRDEMKDKISLLDVDNKTTFKKALISASKCYHTDKNRAYGRDWEWLCGKIMRHVNDLFSYFKGFT